ncbi:MAG: helix-turn-helix transcriptional regulator [Verrucomicrobia bacterium]|jgi:transcriptional regulator with XRE-family HTH domain|nr:helix-turn-helix transcriptional regulator [Verrucomicrobiota bacterium]
MLLFETDRELAQELGARVRRTRIEKRMAQKTLAAKAGIHVNTLRTLERTGEVRLSSFIAVLRALGERSGLESLLTVAPPRDLYSPVPGPPPQRVRERRP